MQTVTDKLFDLQDLAYRDFHAGLMPTVPKEQIIGVRVPVLRKLAKAMYGSEEANVFLADLPHTYYEENNLHAFLLEREKDFSKALSETEQFLPHLDNWATCDMFFPKVFLKHPAEMTKKAKEWMASGETYIVRYGIGILRRMLSDALFSPEYLDWAMDCASGDYYVDMMVAWFFQTAFCKQTVDVLPYFTNRKLSVWVHNKAIQKLIESHQTDQETKMYLRTLKIKG